MNCTYKRVQLPLVPAIQGSPVCVANVPVAPLIENGEFAHCS